MRLDEGQLRSDAHTDRRGAEEQIAAGRGNSPARLFICTA